MAADEAHAHELVHSWREGGGGEMGSGGDLKSLNAIKSLHSIQATPLPPTPFPKEGDPHESCIRHPKL
jgi:hypothetical protein